MAKQIKRKKKIQREVQQGIISIISSFNNSIITIADKTGGVIAWATAGSVGFKGTKKSTPFAAQVAMQKALEKAKLYSLKEVSVTVSGVGVGRESAIRAIQGSGIKVTSIKDVTPIPHNGPRVKKTRRV